MTLIKELKSYSLAKENFSGEAKGGSGKRSIVKVTGQGMR